MKLTFTAAVLALAASAHASSIQVSADKLESRVTHGHTQPHKCITFGGALQEVVNVTDVTGFCEDWNTECSTKAGKDEAQPVSQCFKSPYGDVPGQVTVQCITGSYSSDYLSGNHISHTLQMTKSRNLELVYDAPTEKPVVGDGCKHLSPSRCSTPFYYVDAPEKICKSAYTSSDEEEDGIPVCVQFNATASPKEPLVFPFLLPEGRTHAQICAAFFKQCDAKADGQFEYVKTRKCLPNEDKKSINLGCATTYTHGGETFNEFEIAHNLKLSQLVKSDGKCTPVLDGKCAISNYDTRPRSYCAS